VPRFSCFLETPDQPVTPDHPVWSLPLPSDRQWKPQGLRVEPGKTPSVGDYLGAVQHFLEGPARDAIAQNLAKRGAGSSYPECFRIYLAKHGKFYHPAHVEAHSGGNCFHWVVNVAASPAGTALIRREYALLQKLARQCQPVYVPEVHAFAEVQIGGGLCLPMFLGEWFSGYHEFHLTRSAANGEQGLVLWDSESGNRFLDREQSEKIYCQAARILAHYFKPTSFECIGAWHHAAGDFVARLSASGVDVRLVTVREYRSLFWSRHDPGGWIRISGRFWRRCCFSFFRSASACAWTGWTASGRSPGPSGSGQGHSCGVLEALADKPDPAGLPLDVLFSRYLASCTEEDLLDMCQSLVAKTFSSGLRSCPSSYPGFPNMPPNW